MKPTLAEILKEHPTAVYDLMFKDCTLYNIPTEKVDADIRKEWLSYCPTYRVEVIYEDESIKFEHVYARFYR